MFVYSFLDHNRNFVLKTVLHNAYTNFQVTWKLVYALCKTVFEHICVKQNRVESNEAYRHFYCEVLEC